METTTTVVFEVQRQYPTNDPAQKLTWVAYGKGVPDLETALQLFARRGKSHGKSWRLVKITRATMLDVLA